MATLRVLPEAQAKVAVFREDLCTKTENPVGSYFPKKISESDAFLKEPALSEADLSNLKAPWTSQGLVQSSRKRSSSGRNSRRRKTSMKRRKRKMKTEVLFVAQ